MPPQAAAKPFTYPTSKPAAKHPKRKERDEDNKQDDEADSQAEKILFVIYSEGEGARFLVTSPARMDEEIEIKFKKGCEELEGFVPDKYQDKQMLTWRGTRRMLWAFSDYDISPVWMWFCRCKKDLENKEVWTQIDKEGVHEGPFSTVYGFTDYR